MAITTSPKKYIYLLSSMRAGSTLLKSLLSTKEEITDLPEIPVQLVDEVVSLTREDMVLIKRPRNYSNLTYPHFQFQPGSRIIVLIRKPYDTILSLHKMNLENHFLNIHWYDEQRLLDYWVATYASILENIDLHAENVHLARYEDLIQSPLKITGKIFGFLGTTDTSGVDSYQKPDGYQWKWGFGDGGNVIKTLKVVRRKNKGLNKKLVDLIESSGSVHRLLCSYGYKNIVKSDLTKNIKRLIGLMTLIYPRMELDHIEEWIEHHASLGISHFWICNHGDFVYDAQFGNHQTKTWTKKPGANYNVDLSNEEVIDKLHQILDHCRNKYEVHISLIPVTPTEIGVSADQVSVSMQVLPIAREYVDWIGFFDIDELIVGDLHGLENINQDTSAIELLQKVFEDRWESNKAVAMKSIVSHYGLVNFNRKIIARTSRVTQWHPTVHEISPMYRDGRLEVVNPNLLRFHHFRGNEVPKVKTTHAHNLDKYAKLILQDEVDASHVNT